MALGKEEWTRRVKAAAALHGLELKDLADLEGLPKDAARRAGHPSDTYVPNHALAMALAEKLELPVEWFEAEDWRNLVGVKVYELPPEAQEGLDRQAQQLSILSEVRSEQGRLLTLLEQLARATGAPLDTSQPSGSSTAPLR